VLANKMGHGGDLAADGGLRWFGGMSAPVEVIAHRGANREAPENTLPAFQRALEIGVQGIELDVHLTRDGMPVVHHDPQLPDKMSDGSRLLIASLEMSELRNWSPAPTLDEVLYLVDGRCRLYVEIKAAAAVEPVVERLKHRRSWCALHSFDHRIAERARSLDAELKTGILLVSYLVDIAGAMRAARALDVWQQGDFVDRDLVDRVHAEGGRVIAWTVNDAGRGNALVEIGVDAICSDTPRELLAALTQSST
jgi:glycerophosphoryl diester phosphodiesterase